jgi:hypothetical protein
MAARKSMIKLLPWAKKNIPWYFPTLAEPVNCHSCNKKLDDESDFISCWEIDNEEVAFCEPCTIRREKYYGHKTSKENHKG